MMTSSNPALIDFRHVSVMRGPRLVLHDISLKINPGEHVAIMGPNGCGKSTLIKTITRELYPLADESTSMRILGQERWEISGLRSLLGVVPNDLLPFASRRHINGREAVVSAFLGSVGLWPHQHPAPGMWNKTDELLALLEATHLANRNIHELSAGELRRLLIARALVHNPRALLLDEPSNSLDVFAQGELRRTLRKLAQSGIALLLVTHHLPDLIPEIQRVIFMREGRIVSDGSKKDLLTARSLSSLFGCPVEMTNRDGYYYLV